MYILLNKKVEENKRMYFLQTTSKVDRIMNNPNLQDKYFRVTYNQVPGMKVNFAVDCSEVYKCPFKEIYRKYIDEEVIITPYVFPVKLFREFRNRIFDSKGNIKSDIAELPWVKGQVISKSITTFLLERSRREG